MIKTLATKDTSAQDTIIPQNAIQKGQLPPPPNGSAKVKKKHKSTVPSDFRVGSQVKILSSRENRIKYNGLIGEVCAVVWPGDRERSIIYVKVADRQPCFFHSELKKAVEPAPQVEVEEVQICQ